MATEVLVWESIVAQMPDGPERSIPCIASVAHPRYRFACYATPEPGAHQSSPDSGACVSSDSSSALPRGPPAGASAPEPASATTSPSSSDSNGRSSTDDSVVRIGSQATTATAAAAASGSGGGTACHAKSDATAATAAAAAPGAGGGASVSSSTGGAVGGLAGWFRRLVTEQYLPLMLLTALLAAAVQPSWGLAASRTSLQSAVTFAIFVLQGVMLRRGEAEKALGAKGAICWGLASILIITPLAAPLAGALPLQPPGLALGLLVFACMPTTLSSGVALTQVLGGNTALALLLTIATNLTSVFTLPFILPWALQTSASLGGFCVGGGSGGAAAAVQLDPVPLLVQLVQCILLPTLVGSSLRGVSPGLRSWVDSNRRTLSVISGGLLSLVPWMQVSKALAQGVVVAPGALAAAVGCSLVLHAAYLVLNGAAAEVFRLGGTDPRVAAPTRRALIVVASQKTLPVAMAVLGRLGPAVGSEAAGCAAVTAVFSHLAQTCVDFWLVSRWLEHIRRREAAATTTEAARGGSGQGGGAVEALRPAAG
ncbi:hypothetical protein PLESTB_001378400 [Pleodorina starrii]|uniref:Uncharacterized protein n=1 Tax=Pleodorina starrii TaxID=330485 RepID=A0A9W6BUG9_9CHLO|nr:hypothetical protein PLESTB_001378400 [Pleodorina starrii]